VDANILFIVKCNRERSIDGVKINPGMALVKKLVSVLETIEKLPVLLYESSGNTFTFLFFET